MAEQFISPELASIKKMIQNRQVKSALVALQTFQDKPELTPEEDLLCILLEAAIQNQLKDYEEAQISGQKAYNLSKNLQLPLYTFDALKNLAISDTAIDGIDQLPKRINEMNSVLNSLQNLQEDEKIERVAFLNKLQGMIDFIHGDLEKTIEHYSLALENFQQLEMNFDAVEILNDLGEELSAFGIAGYRIGPIPMGLSAC